MKGLHQITRWIGLALLTFAVSAAVAADPPGSGRTSPLFSRAELEQMLAPIALYPDALLSQVLMAATYPLEVAQAARWSRAHPEAEGQAAVARVESYDWDPSVTSLVAFPEILLMMDDKLDWTERIGDAFVAQRDQVMDAIQELRRVAFEQGHLRSGEYQRVVVEQRVIVIEPADPDWWYLPYYNPGVVYGPWRWTSHPPVRWDAWPGYRSHGSFGWSRGVGVGAGFFFGSLNWRDRRVYTSYHDGFYRGSGGVRIYSTQPRLWYHDHYHRRGVPYGAPGYPIDYDRDRYDRDRYRYRDRDYYPNRGDDRDADGRWPDNASGAGDSYPRRGDGYRYPERSERDGDHDEYRDRDGREPDRQRPPAGFRANRVENTDPRVPGRVPVSPRGDDRGTGRPGRIESRAGGGFSAGGSRADGATQRGDERSSPRFDAVPQRDNDRPDHGDRGWDDGGAAARPGRYGDRPADSGERSGNVPGGRSPGGFSR